MSQKNTQTFTTFLRSIFYALTVNLGLWVANLELSAGNVTTFWQVGMAMMGVFFIELYSSFLSVRTGKIPLNSLSFDDYTRTGQLINHVAIPAALYLGLLLFLFNHRQTEIQLVVLAVNFLISIFLFAHLRAYFARQQHLLQLTHQAYDLAKLLTIFCISSVLLQSTVNLSARIAGVFAIAALMFSLELLILKRYNHLHVRLVLIVAALVLIVAVAVFVLAASTLISPMQLSFVVLVGYYIITAGLQHYIQNDLSRELVAEYILVLASIVVVLWGLSS
jgi:hypothetical protein